MEPGGRGRSSAEGEGGGGEEAEVGGEGDDDDGDDNDDRKGNTGQPPTPPPFSRLAPAPSPSMPGAEAEDERVSSSEERGATASGRRRPCLRGGSGAGIAGVVVETSAWSDGVESDRGPRWRLAPSAGAAREHAGARASIVWRSLCASSCKKRRKTSWRRHASRYEEKKQAFAKERDVLAKPRTSFSFFSSFNF